MSAADRLAFLGKLLHQDASSDLTIKVVEGEHVSSFRVHRSILVCRSAKFRGMLEGSFVESSQTEITLSGMNIASTAMEKLLIYIYTDEVELSGEIAVDLLELASECTGGFKSLR